MQVPISAAVGPNRRSHDAGEGDARLRLEGPAVVNGGIKRTATFVPAGEVRTLAPEKARLGGLRSGRRPGLEFHGSTAKGCRSVVLSVPPRMLDAKSRAGGGIVNLVLPNPEVTP